MASLREYKFAVPTQPDSPCSLLLHDNSFTMLIMYIYILKLNVHYKVRRSRLYIKNVTSEYISVFFSM